MLSVGIDLVELKRISHAMKNPRFLSRVLGKSEYAQLQERGFPVESVAASFCAKEAFAKAMGTGVRGFSLKEVELYRAQNGAPKLLLTGRARRLSEERQLQFAVSVTHTREYASAVVIAQEGNGHE